MKKRFLSCIWLLWISVLAAGCQTAMPTPSPTLDVGSVYTQAVQTISLQLTLDAGQTAIAALTQIAQSTATPSPAPQATAAPQPTGTPAPPTNTLAPATNTPDPAHCNRAEFINDVTVGDGTMLMPGTRFTKIWRIRNSGSCAWTREYELVFFDGVRMDAAPEIPMRGIVQPGETVDITVEMVAPEDQAIYTGYWMLRSATGQYFGIGQGANESLFVEIRVRIPTEVVFNFSQNYCNAIWTNSAGLVPCPGNDANLGIGFVNQYDTPVLETGKADDEPAIVTHPSNGNRGFISGQFPAFRIRSGDRFKTVIGCFFDSFACNVLFQLNYIADGGALKNLDTWVEVYDGKITRVDIDLSPLAGKSVEFVLTVLNNGDATDDWAFWLMPVIVR